MTSQAVGNADPVIRSYAEAIFTVAQAESALERVEDELYRFARAIESNPDLRDRLTDPGIDTGAKLGVVTDLLAGRAHPQTVSAVAYVVQAGRARQLTQIADALVARGSAARAHSLAEVRSAVPLDPAQQRRLSEAIRRSTGREIDLRVIVDPDVVGGVVVKVGDTVVDGTLARRISDLRAALTGG